MDILGEDKDGNFSKTPVTPRKFQEFMKIGHVVIASFSLLPE